MTEPMTDVIYRGRAGSVVTVHRGDGQPGARLPHVVRHSPTGLSWGYAGSGPADLARSLLVDALGDRARCRDCAGTGLVAVPDAGEDEPDVRPYAPGAVECWEADELEPFECGACERGFVDLPYQRFKDEFVAVWGAEWEISRGQIRAWLAEQPETADLVAGL